MSRFSILLFFLTEVRQRRQEHRNLRNSIRESCNFVSWLLLASQAASAVRGLYTLLARYVATINYGFAAIPAQTKVYTETLLHPHFSLSFSLSCSFQPVTTPGWQNLCSLSSPAPFAPPQTARSLLSDPWAPHRN